MALGKRRQRRKRSQERVSGILMFKVSVGSLVRLTVPCMGNAVGTTGVCYDVYNLGGREGYGFIFENGRYDGFAPDEVTSFLEEVGFDPSVSNYQFENVMKLRRDFDSGEFRSVLG